MALMVRAQYFQKILFLSECKSLTIGAKSIQIGSDHQPLKKSQHARAKYNNMRWVRRRARFATRTVDSRKGAKIAKEEEGAMTKLLGDRCVLAIENPASNESRRGRRSSMAVLTTCAPLY